jgi:hypothetical protein
MIVPAFYVRDIKKVRCKDSYPESIKREGKKYLKVKKECCIKIYLLSDTAEPIDTASTVEKPDGTSSTYCAGLGG